MNKYETIIILRPDLETDEYVEIERAYKNLLVMRSDRSIRIECWGKKKLAYPVKSHVEGYYMMFTHHMTASDAAEFDEMLANDTNVIKHIMVLAHEAEDDQRSEDEQIDEGYIPCLMDILLQE